MAIKTKAQLKAYFTTGSKPTQAQFEDLIDTLFNDNIADIPLATTTAKGLLSQLSGNSSQWLRGDGVFSAIPLASTSSNGLLRTLNSNTLQFLRGDGYWPAIPAVSSTASGLCPKLSGSSTQYLTGAGTFVSLPSASANAAGLMSAANFTKLANVSGQPQNLSGYMVGTANGVGLSLSSNVYGTGIIIVECAVNNTTNAINTIGLLRNMNLIEVTGNASNMTTFVTDIKATAIKILGLTSGISNFLVLCVPKLITGRIN